MKKYYTYVIIILILFVLGLIFFNFNKTDIKNTIIGGYDHGLQCNDLPTYEKVVKVVQEHQSDFPQIPDINGDFSKDKVDPLNYISKFDGKEDKNRVCPEKADLLFYAETRNTVEEIKNKLGKDFYGVPYRVILI